MAALWRKAGHEVTALGRGGDANGADVVVVAVPGPAISAALGTARAIEDLAWLLAAAVKDGAPVFYRFAVQGEL